MPRVIRALPGPARVDQVHDRLEIDVSAALDVGPPQKYQINTSYKKHCFPSYTVQDGYNPTAADSNTVVVVDDHVFKAAFDAYARALCSAISKAPDVATFDPSSTAGRLPGGNGITFHSDVTQVGGNIHCFPVAGPKCMVFNKKDFGHFKDVMRFVFGDHRAAKNTSLWREADRGWPIVSERLKTAGVFNEIQAKAVERRLRRAKTEIATARNAENLHYKMKAKPDDGARYRGHWTLRVKFLEDE